MVNANGFFVLGFGTENRRRRRRRRGDRLLVNSNGFSGLGSGSENGGRRSRRRAFVGQFKWSLRFRVAEL